MMRVPAAIRRSDCPEYVGQQLARFFDVDRVGALNLCRLVLAEEQRREAFGLPVLRVDKACETCGGTGWVVLDEVDGSRCWLCRGTGWRP